MKPIDLLLSYFPNTKPIFIGAEDNGSLKIDVFTYPGDSENYFVVSQKQDGAFVPVVVSENPHIPYKMELVNAKPPAWSGNGVFVSVLDIYEPEAEKIKFVINQVDNPIYGQCDVTNSKAVIFSWDSKWIAAELLPKVVELYIKGKWLPTVSRDVPATADGFFKAFVKGCETGDEKYDWARDFRLNGPLSGEGHYNYMLPLMQAIIDRSEVGDAHLGDYGAGATEDMISHERFIDYLEKDKKNRGKWKDVLSSVYLPSGAPEICERIKRFLST